MRYLTIIVTSILSQGLLAADAFDTEILSAMKKSAQFMRSISTHGGYCGIYSLDLKQRFGEATYEKAKDTEIWVQPPGTPSVGQCWLRAYKATGDAYYLDAVREVAKALVWGQRAIGGWDHRVDVSHLTEEAVEPLRREGRCSFDDNVTQGALAFLIDADEVLEDLWLTDGIELGLRFMLQSQFPNGAWPQWYPLRGGYHDYYTFNDHAMNDCIALMLKAHTTYDKAAYLQSACKGSDFIIASQGKTPQAGWSQQYSHDMKPAWARSFEPPGICSYVTANNIRTLTDLYLYTENEQYLSPIPAAIEWLNHSPIGPNRWARLYEVGSNRPIYGDRENGGKVFYDYAKISEKERTSYGWQGEYGIGSSIGYYQSAKEVGPPAWKRKQSTPRPSDPTRNRPILNSRMPEIRRIIEAMDEQGRWITNNAIRSESFVRHFNTLCSAAESLQAGPDR
ncbi:MAG: hypothetical protein JW828_06235 [Sedimentisphaerales bacterium]|nr:hypothetical protein [Sedimentisphaerales bacterium]